jgi:hypothetical protein
MFGANPRHRAGEKISRQGVRFTVIDQLRVCYLST